MVFGAAIGSRIAEIDGVSYGAFIVPGLIMLSLLTQSISNASFGIYFPSSPARSTRCCRRRCRLGDRDRLRRRGGHQVDHLGLIILATAGLFVPLQIAHPLWMITFLVLTSVTFSLFGFIIGIWADGFEKLQIVPLLVITPLTFLGGTLLLDRHAAARVADGHAVQPGRLSDQRLSLELLRDRRRERRPSASR